MSTATATGSALRIDDETIAWLDRWVKGVRNGIENQASLRAATNVLQRPVDYLLHAQNEDGGLGAQAGPPSSSLFAGWAALGLESAGVRLQSVDRGPGLIAYLERSAGAADAGSIERNILVARAAGLNATNFGGHDLVAMLRAKFARDGEFDRVARDVLIARVDDEPGDIIRDRLRPRRRLLRKRKRATPLRSSHRSQHR